MNFGLRNPGHEAKPAGSDQLAAIRTTDYKTAISKKSTPPHGFSKFRIAYCYLPTSFPWRLGAKNFVEVVLLNTLSARI